jgi:hypothetical protein
METKLDLPFKVVCIADFRESIRYKGLKAPRLGEIVTVVDIVACECGCGNPSFILEGFDEPFRDELFMLFEHAYIELPYAYIVYLNPQILN